MHDLSDTILEAIDRSGIGMTIVTDDGERLERVYANGAAAALLGFAPEEFSRMPPLLPVAPEEQERLRGMLARTRGGDAAPERFETWCVRKDGTRVPVEVSLTLARRGSRQVTVAFLRDLREQRRFADALRKSEARFRQLAEAAPDTIAVFCDGRFVYANPAASQSLGYTEEEFLRLSPRDFLSEGDARSMVDRIQRVLGGERMAPVEYRGVHKDGRPVVMEISSELIEWEGRPAVIAVGRDVTERKALQAELLRADRMAALGTLAAGVAHEINNPLTFQLLNLSWLERKLPDKIPDPEFRERALKILAEAVEGGMRVSGIVRQLLAFSRPDVGRKHDVDVESILESTLQLAHSSLRHRARVVREYGKVPPVAATDALLGQVFLNLIINAVQSFTSDSPQRNEIRVRTRGRGADVVVEVLDNGRGISDQVLPRVFDPFFTTKPVGEGTGLGLAISRSIILSLGGSIEIEPRTEGGVMARVTLPASR